MIIYMTKLLNNGSFKSLRCFRELLKDLITSNLHEFNLLEKWRTRQLVGYLPHPPPPAPPTNHVNIHTGAKV